MRITGGFLKGWQIHTRFAHHVRPTTDMMREAIFNKLTHGWGIEGCQALDLFSGSGIMSIELISRGAAEVVSVDRDAKNIANQKAMKKEKNLENWQIMSGDVFKMLENAENTYDLIFADPPYDMPGIQNLAEMAVKKLKPDGVFFLEHRPGIIFSTPVFETKKYGSTAISIFQPA